MSSRASDYVDKARLWQRLIDLAAFGATPTGGVRRLALSPEEIGARAELVRWARQLGLMPAVDAIASSGKRPRRSIDIVAWFNEEGARFAPGMMGSAVFTATRQLAEVEQV